MYDIAVRIPSTAGNTYQVHGYLGNVFRKPVLWREAETESGRFAIVRVETPPETAPAKPVTAPALGAIVHFRLIANPMITNAGKRVPILDPKQSVEWLTYKAPQHGFEVVQAIAEHEPVHIERRKEGCAPFTINRVTFVGVLRVTDVANFGILLKRGIGRARAWGCGMMEVEDAGGRLGVRISRPCLNDGR